MDNATKAIMIGVGLFITVIIISAVLVVVNMGRGFITNASDQLSGTLTQVTTASQFVSELKGDTLNETEVKQVLDLASKGTYKFPVVLATNRAAGSEASVSVKTIDGGYAISGTTNNVIGTTPYAVEGNTYRLFTNDAASITEYTSTTTVANGDYTAVVIQSRSSSDLGLYLYK